MQANWIKFDLISHPQSPRLAHIYDYNNCYSVCLSQVGLLYMCTRLIVNLSQVYLSMYLTESLNLCKVSHSSRQGSLLILAHRHYGDQCFFLLIAVIIKFLWPIVPFDWSRRIDQSKGSNSNVGKMDQTLSKYQV